MPILQVESWEGQICERAERQVLNSPIEEPAKILQTESKLNAYVSMPEIKFLLLTCNRSGYCWTMEISVDSIRQALSETSVKHSSKEDASLVLPRSAIRLALSDKFCFDLKQSLTVFLVGGKMRFISWSKSEQCIFHPRLNNVTIRAFIRTDQVRK